MCVYVAYWRHSRINKVFNIKIQLHFMLNFCMCIWTQILNLNLVWNYKFQIEFKRNKIENWKEKKKKSRPAHGPFSHLCGPTPYPRSPLLLYLFFFYFPRTAAMWASCVSSILFVDQKPGTVTNAAILTDRALRPLRDSGRSTRRFSPRGLRPCLYKTGSRWSNRPCARKTRDG
jgi:hypothetical protein